MEKSSSVTAAFAAGKLPSTQQFNAFIDWLNDVGITQVEPSSNTELSSRGRILAGAIRQTLDAYKRLLNNKNGDDILQEGLWHLTEGDLSPTSEAKGEKDEAKEDLRALRTSLRKVLSIVWDSFSSEGTSIFHDMLSLIRLSLADAAELIEEQASGAKETLRQVEDEVQAGERDTFGRSKKRLEEEKNVKVAWEHGMDSVKNAGSKVIDVTQTATEKAEKTTDKTTDRLSDALTKIATRAQEDEEYKNSLDTIFSILQKRINAGLDAAADPNITISKFIADTTPEQHIPKAIDLFRIFIERLAGTSLDPFIGHFRSITNSIMRDPELKQWFDDALGYARRCLVDREYAGSEAATGDRKNLRVRWRTFSEKDEKWKRSIEDLKKEWNTIENGIRNDSDVTVVRNAQQNLTRGIQEGLEKVGEEVGGQAQKAQSTLEAAMEQATWFWQDLFKVYLPKALSKMRDFPIPRTEYKDDEVEFVLENLDISSLNILPSHVYIRNITDIDIQTSASPITPSRTSIGTLTHIQIQALQLSLDDVSFWYSDKTAGPLTPSEFSGLLALALPEKGVDLDLKVRLIPATKTGSQSREHLGHFHVVEVAEVNISNEVEFQVKESNHTLITTMLKPLVVSRLREALQRTLSQQLRAVVDWADGVAYDVSRRQVVFADTGLGNGGSLIAALWSEIGRLQRESRVDQREFGVHATGTGVIVEQKSIRTGEGEERPTISKSAFAMGAEPQILSGEKRGPLGTGSEPIANKLERAAKELGVDTQELEGMDVDVKGAAKQVVGEVRERASGVMQAASEKVGSFRSSVERKTKLEQTRPGWQSAAFDF